MATTATTPPAQPVPVKRDFRQEVTDSIIRMLEEGVAPWQKPWKPGALELPLNPTTERAYRGGNAVHLLAVGTRNGYSDPRWLTYKQAQENGWQVRKGEKGSHIEYWQFPERNSGRSRDGAQPDTGSEPSAKDGENGRRGLIHRIYTVFNAQQIDGVPAYQPRQRQEWEVVQSGEQILEHSGARIRHDQNDRAYYSRSADEIHLPPQAAFPSPAEYYGTALHELGHWTGHPERLNRTTLNESYRFGDPSYAKEELRAELASVFLAAERGIPHNPEQHAAYVKGWVEALRGDKNEFFRAAKDAHQAADLLIALERERSPEKALEAVRGASVAGRETSEWSAQYEPGSRTVDITEKQTATERRSPTAGTGTAKLEQERILDNEVDGRGQPNSSDLQRSLDAARKLAQEKLGSDVRVYAAHTDSGNYRGTIIGETEHHVLQQLNERSTALHPKHLLQQTPALGDSLRISYSNNAAALSAFQPRAKSRELAR